MAEHGSEDGVNAGHRNMGRFFLFAIPAVLGIAASIWLGVYIGIHNFRRELSQEDRRAVFVGAYQRPKSKLRIETPAMRCLKITHVDLDGGTATVYFQNNCTGETTNRMLRYQTLAPDGTVLHGGWDWTYTGSLKGGEQAEVIEKLELDDRAAGIRFWIED